MNDARTWVEEAHRRFSNGDCTGALAAYQQARQYAPALAEALLGEGMVQVALEQFGRARDCFAQLAQTDEALPAARVWLRRMERLLASSEQSHKPGVALPPPDQEDEWSEGRLAEVRARRRAQQLRRKFVFLTLTSSGTLFAVILLTASGALRPQSDAPAWPPLPVLPSGLPDYSGVYHALVPGVFISVVQQGDQATLISDLSLDPARREPLRVTCYVTKDALNAGSVRLFLHEGGWTGDCSLGRAVIANGCQRVRSTQERRGWELLALGQIPAARRAFLRAAQVARHAPGAHIGLLATDYANGLLAKVYEEAPIVHALAAQHDAPLLADYALHLRQSAIAQMHSVAGSNAMDHILAGIAHLPEKSLALSPDVERALHGHEPLGLSHRPEIERGFQRYAMAYQKLLPLTNCTYCAWAEPPVPERSARAWALLQGIDRLEAFAEMVLLSAQLELASGNGSLAWERIHLVTALGARLLQAGVGGSQILHTGLSGYQRLFFDALARQPESTARLIGELDALRRSVSWEQLQLAQRGNLAARLRQAQDMRDDGENLRCRVALADLDLACVGAALLHIRNQNGSYPTALAELPDGLLTSGPPRDPFDGASLRYLRDGHRTVVYSIGPDGRDDHAEKPLGWSSRNPLTGDILLPLPDEF